MAPTTINDLAVETRVQILSDLSPKAIQRGRRVNKNFRALIDKNVAQIAKTVHKRNLLRLECAFYDLCGIELSNKDEFLEVLSRLDLHLRQTRPTFSAVETARLAAMHYVLSCKGYRLELDVSDMADAIMGLSSVGTSCYRMRFSDWPDDDPHTIKPPADPCSFMLLMTHFRYPSLKWQFGFDVETLRSWFVKVTEPNREYFTRHLGAVYTAPVIPEPRALTPLTVRGASFRSRSVFKPHQSLDESTFCALFGLPRIPTSLSPDFAWCINDGAALEFLRNVTEGKTNNPLVKAWLLEEMFLYQGSCIKATAR